MYHRMKNSHGGGECFSKNIMNNLTLEDSVLFALENLNNILEDFKLDDNEKEIIRKKCEKFIQKSIKEKLLL